MKRKTYFKTFTSSQLKDLYSIKLVKINIDHLQFLTFL